MKDVRHNFGRIQKYYLSNDKVLVNDRIFNYNWHINKWTKEYCNNVWWNTVF